MDEKRLIVFIKKGVECAAQSARLGGLPLNEEMLDQAIKWLDQKYEKAE